jgi:hypothetical protein
MLNQLLLSVQCLLSSEHDCSKLQSIQSNNKFFSLLNLRNWLLHIFRQMCTDSSILQSPPI